MDMQTDQEKKSETAKPEKEDSIFRLPSKKQSAESDKIKNELMAQAVAFFQKKDREKSS